MHRLKPTKIEDIIWTKWGISPEAYFKSRCNCLTHKEKWTKLYDVQASDNMELELTYEVKKL